MNSTIRINSLTRTIIAGASLVVLIAGMRAASVMISPLLLALFLAVLLYPSYQWLLHRGIPTWLAVSIMVLGVLAVGLGLLGLLWLSLAQLRTNLFIYANRLVDLRMDLELMLTRLGVDVPALVTQELLNRQVLVSTAARLLANAGSLLFSGFLVIVATIFFLFQATHLSARMSRELGPNSLFQTQAVQVAQRVARFFVIRVRVNLIVAAGITVWLFILDVDLALLWGIVAFFLSFIMYVGLGLAAVPPTLLGLAEGGIWTAVLVIVGVIVINVVVENVLAPSMMGQGLNLAPVVALASLVFWAWVLGPLGFILAIPLTVIVVMILASNPETHWLTVLLTMDTVRLEGSPPPQPPADVEPDTTQVSVLNTQPQDTP